MKKPTKKRPTDPILRMASIMKDVEDISRKPIVAPAKKKKR
ncbi:MAG TPA: hypothetical protein VN048_18505 [Verrucomicrobiae bacterium]|nr:hypothetical protein [Verrucomicrobiae bacterium]